MAGKPTFFRHRSRPKSRTIDFDRCPTYFHKPLRLRQTHAAPAYPTFGHGIWIRSPGVRCSKQNKIQKVLISIRSKSKESIDCVATLCVANHGNGSVEQCAKRFYPLFAHSSMDALFVAWAEPLPPPNRFLWFVCLICGCEFTTSAQFAFVVALKTTTTTINKQTNTRCVCVCAVSAAVVCRVYSPKCNNLFLCTDLLRLISIQYTSVWREFCGLVGKCCLD